MNSVYLAGHLKCGAEASRLLRIECRGLPWIRRAGHGKTVNRRGEEKRSHLDTGFGLVISAFVD